MRHNLILFALVTISQICLGQSTILVPDDYITIRKALQASSPGDIILVSPGTYNEQIVWPANAVGVELRSTHGASGTIIDGMNSGRVLSISKNNFVSNDIDESTIIDGFTIQNGYIEGSNTRGAGIKIDNASPSLRNLIIKNNTNTSSSWGDGAGLYLNASRSRLENCIITDNSITSTSWAYGSGVYISDSEVSLIGCTIENNTNSSSNWAYGGGVYCDESDLLLKQCTIANNTTNGGGWSYGAGIYIYGPFMGDINKIDVIGCTITGNRPIGSRPYGSALYTSQSLDIDLINTLIHSNGTSTSTLYFDDVEVNISNITMANNQSGIYCRETELDILNSIFWDNDYFINISDWNIESTVNVNYSLIEDGYHGEGNIATDPLFVHESSYSLSEESPCLNAGSKEIDYNTDISGRNRPAPLGSNPDIGAYEIDQRFSHVLTRFYFDENTNGELDPNETYIPKGGIVLNNEVVVHNTKSVGIFTAVDNGLHTIAYDESSDPIWYLTSTPDAYDFEVMGDNYADTLDFGLSPNREIAQIKTAIYSPNLRCNRTITMEFSVTNLGTIIEEGILWANLDSRVSEITPLIEEDITEDLKFGWYFENLAPGETFTRLVSFKVPGVAEIEQGELLHFSSEAISSINETVRDEFNYSDEVRCAYDPNDKLVNPNRDDNFILLDKEITYTIRFQNVGNDYADDVRVVDTLDSNLDLASFNLLRSSHPDQLNYTLSDDGVLNFDFHQIFLPDSTTNEPESHGFIMYSIKPDSTVETRTVIENTAHIFFDFNPAIVTNTTSNIITTSFPTTSNTTDDYLTGVKLYPNPSFGRIHFSDIIEKIEIMDLNGKQIAHKNDTQVLDISDHVNGTYIARITYSGRVYYKKIVLLQ